MNEVAGKRQNHPERWITILRTFDVSSKCSCLLILLLPFVYVLL